MVHANANIHLATFSKDIFQPLYTLLFKQLNSSWVIQDFRTLLFEFLSPACFNVQYIFFKYKNVTMSLIYDDFKQFCRVLIFTFRHHQFVHLNSPKTFLKIDILRVPQLYLRHS